MVSIQTGTISRWHNYLDKIGIINSQNVQKLSPELKNKNKKYILMDYTFYGQSLEKAVTREDIKSLKLNNVVVPDDNEILEFNN